MRSPGRPTAADVVDVCAVVVLTALAGVGFRSLFEGGVGVGATAAAGLVGALLGWALTRSRLTFPTGFAVAAVAFVVLATPPVTGSATGVSELASGVSSGWLRLLTSAAPAGREEALLAVPVLCGYLGGVLGVALALRFPRLLLGALPPLAVLAVGILFGLEEPASLLLQGAGAALVLVVWAAWREGRARSVSSAGAAGRRAVSAVALLALAATGGLLAGPYLPGVDPDERLLLREHVSPPFEPRAYPSPLAGYRRYTDPERREDVLFTAQGLPPGARIRLAVLDDYDGLVWRVGQAEGDEGFQRVGDRLPGRSDGSLTVRVTAQTAEVPWLPVVGVPSSVTFDGERADRLRTSFRWSSALRAAAVPAGLRAGDSWTVRTEAEAARDESALARLPVDGAQLAPPPAGLPSVVGERAAEIVADAETPYAKARRLEQALQRGYYSDGGEQAPVLPGHSVAHVNDFLKDDELLVGNGEQYASTMALMARTVGLPARVVMGFQPTEPQVRGADVRAWVEVAFASAGWVSFDPTPPKDRVPPKVPDPSTGARNTKVEPPPPPVAPPPVRPDPRALQEDERADDEEPGKRALSALLPIVATGMASIVALVLPPAVVVGVKARRRSRRRTSGTPSAQISAGWAELLDRARDTGATLQRTWTRRETAGSLAVPQAVELAARADQAVFAAEDPDPEASRHYWAQVDEARRSLLADLPRHKRWRAQCNPATLRRNP